jgi:hypothetical protein
MHPANQHSSPTPRRVLVRLRQDDTLKAMSSPVLRAGRTRRPAVLDAARHVIIPLRPLGIGEILDGAFLIVRRNVRLMVGLPLVVAGAAAAYVLAGVGMWVALGNTTAQTAQIVLTVLMGLLGMLLLQQCLVWMTAILSRVSLQTVLGEGFAPTTGAVSLRTSLPLFWPVLGLSVLQYTILSVVSGAVSLLYNVVVIGSLAAGIEDDGFAVAGLIATTMLFALVLVVAYAYLALTVPALAAESRRAPGWIGLPARPTNVLTAFARSFALIGSRNLLRVTLVFAGMVAICGALVLLVALGASLILVVYASSINLDLYLILTNGWTIFGVTTFSVLVAMSAILAYVSAVQALVYLDLRMRREGLDLAMRFDCVPIPQPSAPPTTQGWRPA